MSGLPAMPKQIRKSSKTAKRKRQERRFCRLYAEYQTGTYCVIRAGIQVKCPDQLAIRLLKQPAIQAEITKQYAILEAQDAIELEAWKEDRYRAHLRVEAERAEMSDYQIFLSMERDKKERERIARRAERNTIPMVYTSLEAARAAGHDV